MQNIYEFRREDDINPTGGQIQTQVNTSIRGTDPSLDAILSGVQSFIVACGFELNGSGIGHIPPAE
jgi:hypothetical protein|tara:strand:- start:57 stop:254 length:198 start_codon:yes stop_codon:yes gene_type:complete